MTDDVLLRSVLPDMCSATQGAFAVKGQSCDLSDFFSLIGIEGANCSPFSFCSFIHSFFASRYPGLCDRGGVVSCFRQHCVNKVGSYVFPFAVASHCGGY